MGKAYGRDKSGRIQSPCLQGEGTSHLVVTSVKTPIFISLDFELQSIVHESKKIVQHCSSDLCFLTGIQLLTNQETRTLCFKIFWVLCVISGNDVTEQRAVQRFSIYLFIHAIYTAMTHLTQCFHWLFQCESKYRHRYRLLFSRLMDATRHDSTHL